MRRLLNFLPVTMITLSNVIDRSFPDGLDIEIFSAETLATTARNALTLGRVNMLRLTCAQVLSLRLKLEISG